MAEIQRKRKRAAISCTLCRRRKIRCDRERPCSNCVKSRIQSIACTYGTESLEPRSVQPGRPQIQPRQAFEQLPRAAPNTWSFPPVGVLPPTASSTTSGASLELESMRRKVADLESQLSRATAAMAEPSPASTQSIHITSGLSGPIDVLLDSRSFGQGQMIMRGTSHKNRVLGQSHWMNGFVIFRDLIEILEPVFKGGTSASSMPAGIQRAKTLARVIKSQRSPEWPTLPSNNLPPKTVCDELVENYLRTMETLYRILHVPTFWREYEALWNSGSEPKPYFMMQLKLVMAIGAVFYDRNCSMRAEATRWIYEAHTWLSSPDLKSRLGIRSLQTSILLLLAREMVDVGSELVWISAGSLLREAVYIGLHKSPATLPRMNFLEAELRRRLWNTILELNLQFSLISGGPCLVSQETFNTEPPGNFNDDQLIAADASMSPDHAFTHTSLAIALRKTFLARLAVVKFLNDLATTGTYEQTLRVDADMRAAYKILRCTLQDYKATKSSLSGFALDAVDFIMQRYISSLHIPYFNASLHEAVFAFSRKTVLDTSLQIWNLATSANLSNSTSNRANEPDIARVCICGAGFFRAFAFHASSFLAVELRSQIQEDSVPRPDLINIPQDAANMVLRTMEAGETGIKGYLLMCIIAAQIEGIKRRANKEEMTALLGKATEDAIATCLPMLEGVAGQEPDVTGVEDAASDFDFQISPEVMENWDTMMSDVFNLDTLGGGMFDGFSI